MVAQSVEVAAILVHIALRAVMGNKYPTAVFASMKPE